MQMTTTTDPNSTTRNELEWCYLQTHIPDHVLACEFGFFA